MRYLTDISGSTVETPATEVVRLSRTCLESIEKARAGEIQKERQKLYNAAMKSINFWRRITFREPLDKHPTMSVADFEPDRWNLMFIEITWGRTEQIAKRLLKVAQHTKALNMQVAIDELDLILKWQ